MHDWLRDEGRDAEAIGLLRECVQLRERKLGANHPAFISSSEALASWEAEHATPTLGDVAEGIRLANQTD
jgi:hypothetical protein